MCPMVTCFLQGGVLISALLRQACCVQTCYHLAVQEAYDGNLWQLHFVSLIVEHVELNDLHNWYRLLEMWQSELQSFGRSKQLTCL
jgi:hypothetical protein